MLRRRPMRGLESPAASRGCIRVDRIGSGREELGRMEGIREEGGEWGPRLRVGLRLALGFWVSEDKVSEEQKKKEEGRTQRLKDQSRTHGKMCACVYLLRKDNDVVCIKRYKENFIL